MRAPLGFLILLTVLLPACSSLAVVYVDRNAPGPAHDGTSWDTAFVTIQEGVNAATPGGEVWVADGTYAENVVMGEGVQLYGGFLGAEPGGYETGLDQRDFATHVAKIDAQKNGSCVSAAEGTRLDGFTLINGSTGQGGGIFCGSASPVITNNTITGGVVGEGGAIHSNGGAPTITNNTITGNTAGSRGGGVCCYSSAPTILGNTFSGNRAIESGGGIYCNGGSAIISNNTFSSNYGDTPGGAICCYSCSVTIADNRFKGNDARLGGGVFASSCSATIADNTFEGNSGGSAGGALYCSGSTVAIINNSITSNRCEMGDGGALYCETSWLLVGNNVIAANAAQSAGGGVWCDDPSGLTLSCNDVWGNTPDNYCGCQPGPGDISADPLFADPGTGDLHLSPGSPCIDAGDNALPGLPPYDFEGDPRIVDGDGDDIAVVDMGADEYRLVYVWTSAPEGWFVPGWVWFSIPLAPHEPGEASEVLGFDCTNRLYAWDDASKDLLLYPEDFTDLLVGPGYLARLAVGEEYVPAYEGLVPRRPFEQALAAAGWCWVGVPRTTDIPGVNLSVRKGGITRTANDDRHAVDPWLNWNWIFWDPVEQTFRIMNPFGGGDDTALHPWWGYLVWSNTENVTIILP